MIDLKALYYEKFLPFLVESYAKTIKAAKPGHCMKVTGLAMSELKTLIPMLRTVNPEISISFCQKMRLIRISSEHPN